MGAALLMGGEDIAGTSSAYWAAQKGGAMREVVEGFNRIGARAGKLRQAMSGQDAEAFDAVMHDIMGALAALPEVEVKGGSKPDAIRVEGARPDRIGQLRPEVAGLVKFFGRYRDSAESAENRKLFGEAEKRARRMLAALPLVMPVVERRAAR